MPTLEVNNRELHYLDEGEGPTLLFGHSYLWDSTMWRQQLAALRTSYRCLVPDLWGHGQSAPLIAPLTEPPPSSPWQTTIGPCSRPWILNAVA